MVKISVRSAFRTFRDTVRSQLWPLPTLGVALAVIAGFALPYLDTRLDEQLAGWLNTIVFDGDAGAARTVLDAVASSLITVTALTFSLTVVTLQLASSQFSPRLLRTFTQDLFVQVTLTIFLATFTYSLTVLKSVRSAQESAIPFVPRLAITTSYLLALVSVVTLVLFLAHLTRQIRVETMLLNVHIEATHTLASNLKRLDQSRPEDRSPPSQPTGAELLWAHGSGFLLRIDQNDLLRATIAADAVVLISRQLGSFVVAGTPCGSIWPHANGRLDPDDLDTFRSKLKESVHLGPERTTVQDVSYGLRQLTDVTTKALSPGINDPTTAIHSLGHTSALLTELTEFDLGPLVLRDDDDVARVVLNRPDFGQYLDLALTQPRSYGGADPQVLARLYLLLADLAWHAREDQRDHILDQLIRLDGTAATQDFDEAEAATLIQLRAEVHDVLAHPAAAGSRPQTGPAT